MKVSARVSLVVALTFAALCLAYGGYGWWELRGMPESQARDDARGFVLFWLFLAAMGIVSAFVSWRMARDQPSGRE